MWRDFRGHAWLWMGGRKSPGLFPKRPNLECLDYSPRSPTWTPTIPSLCTRQPPAFPAADTGIRDPRPSKSIAGSIRGNTFFGSWQCINAYMKMQTTLTHSGIVMVLFCARELSVKEAYSPRTDATLEGCSKRRVGFSERPLPPPSLSPVVNMNLRSLYSGTIRGQKVCFEPVYFHHLDRTCI